MAMYVKKETGDYRQANESYSEEQVKVVDAKKNDGGYHKVYTDYIVTGGVSTKYCEKGTLQGDYCYEYTQKLQIQKIIVLQDMLKKVINVVNILI